MITDFAVNIAASADGIMTRAAIDGVITRPAAQRVIIITAIEMVITITTIDGVTITGPAYNIIIPIAFSCASNGTTFPNMKDNRSIGT